MNTAVSVRDVFKREQFFPACESLENVRRLDICMVKSHVTVFVGHLKFTFISDSVLKNVEDLKLFTK